MRVFHGSINLAGLLDKVTTVATSGQAKALLVRMAMTCLQ